VEAGYKDGEKVPLESGHVVPAFRLPTEAEWEYAAMGMIGTLWLDEMQTHQRLYPWDGHALRNPYGKAMGTFLANFKRGRGDYAGIAGRLNDGALITSYIYDYPPNDYGLYNMAGNVSEWVMDVYRPLSHQDFDDLNPIRRDDFLDRSQIYKPQYETDTASVKGANGEFVNGADGKRQIEKKYTKRHVKGTGEDEFVSLISDKARVYKGGSWKDVAYWMSPGTRRFLDEDSATATIGFRCAMIRAGSNY
jgi:formylglycine-generating enzyme required for sulfatase activity